MCAEQTWWFKSEGHLPAQLALLLWLLLSFCACYKAGRTSLESVFELWREDLVLWRCTTLVVRQITQVLCAAFWWCKALNCVISRREFLLTLPQCWSKTVPEHDSNYVPIKTVRYIGDYRQWLYTVRTQELSTAHTRSIVSYFAVMYFLSTRLISLPLFVL